MDDEENPFDDGHQPNPGATYAANFRYLVNHIINEGGNPFINQLRRWIVSCLDPTTHPDAAGDFWELWGILDEVEDKWGFDSQGKPVTQPEVLFKDWPAFQRNLKSILAYWANVEVSHEGDNIAKNSFNADAQKKNTFGTAK
jgi:hypothetical protein